MHPWIGLRQSGQLNQSKCVAGLVAMRSLTGAKGSKKVRQFKLPAQWPWKAKSIWHVVSNIVQ